MFDGIPISVDDVAKSEVESTKGGVKPRAPIDEERGLVDLMFLAEFVEEHTGSDGGARQKEPDVKGAIRHVIDHGEQLELLVVDPDHGLVNRDLIGWPPIGGLLVGLLHPGMDGGSVAIDAKLIKYKNCIYEW